MKKLLVCLLFLPIGAWATFQPVTGSTVTVIPPTGGTMPVSGTLSVNTHAVTQSGTWTVSPAATNLVVTSTTTLPVSLAANQSVNVAQINAVTPLMGAGNTGTGSPRMTLATDNAAIATWGQGATGAAVPSGAVYRGGIAKTALPTAATDGNLTGTLLDKFGRTVTIPNCPRELLISTSVLLTANTNETVLLSSGTTGVFNDLVAIFATNTDASTYTSVDVRSKGGPGLSNSVEFTLPGLARGPAGGLTTGVTWIQAASAAAWTVQSSASVSSVRVSALFCQNK